MKLWTNYLTVILSMIIISACSNSSEQSNQIVSPDGILTGTEMTQAEVKQMHLDRMADLGIYNVIVTDVDGWDIMLRQVRNRTNRNVVSYIGDMGYYSGSNYYEGPAAGIWDYENYIFSCTCLDAAWSGGRINYVMPFIGYSDLGYVTLNGPYYYLENPNRLDRINAWVYEGEFRYLSPGLASSTGKAPAPKIAEEIAEYLSRDREVGLKILDGE